jgi:hypothetical protein
VWTVVDKAATEWERKQRRSGDKKGCCGACGKDGCAGCGACPFEGDAESAKEGRAEKAEEF